MEIVQSVLAFLSCVELTFDWCGIVQIHWHSWYKRPEINGDFVGPLLNHVEKHCLWSVDDHLDALFSNPILEVVSDATEGNVLSSHHCLVEALAGEDTIVRAKFEYLNATVLHHFFKS